MAPKLPQELQSALLAGQVIPAHPLALTPDRKLNERRQRALTRYYIDAGAGGIAVGVHTTQFEIRDPKHGLYRPVLELAAETVDAENPALIKIAGICGDTPQAVAEAELAASLGYHIGLLNLGSLPESDEERLLQHCRAVAEVLPLMGFYLQPAVGGRPLSARFWARFCEIENVVAIKIAPFDRYRTLDVLRGVVESSRADEIALYTGNDDNIIFDLITPYELPGPGGPVRLRIVGGLLGQWAVWTHRAVQIFQEIKGLEEDGYSRDLLVLAAQWTDANKALFDADNAFAGCIPGIHEALRRSGLLEGRWCLDPSLDLSPGQQEEIDRVYAAYPHLRDDDFVQERLDIWLR